MFALLMDQLTNAKVQKDPCSPFPTCLTSFQLWLIVGLVKDFCSVDGVINGIREFFGPQRDFLYDGPEIFPKRFFIASNIWQGLGWGAIVYLAALSGVDPHLHEAATLDGATAGSVSVTSLAGYRSDDDHSC